LSIDQECIASGSQTCFLFFNFSKYCSNFIFQMTWILQFSSIEKKNIFLLRVSVNVKKGWNYKKCTLKVWLLQVQMSCFYKMPMKNANYCLTFQFLWWQIFLTSIHYYWRIKRTVLPKTSFKIIIIKAFEVFFFFFASLRLQLWSKFLVNFSFSPKQKFHFHWAFHGFGQAKFPNFFGFKLEPIFTTALAASKNDARFKSGQNRL